MTTTTSSSPRTLADSAPQLIQHDPLCTRHGSFNQVALPDPTRLHPSPAKRRTKADRRLLFELDRAKNASTRRSSHKAMMKRIFFLLSGRHHMRKAWPTSCETVLQLDKKTSLVSQYRLPSFRDGFSDSVQDIGHMHPVQSEIARDRVACWQEDAGLRLPSILTLLKSEWY